MKVKHMNALLVEIMMAVLFFALAAVVILEVFAAGYNLSAEADAIGRAVNHVQMISEQLYTADDMTEALMQSGFEAAEDAWQLDAGDYALQVCVSVQETEAGALQTAQIIAMREDETIASLPCVRYVAGEVES